MKRMILATILALLVVAPLGAQEADVEKYGTEPPKRFAAVDVFLDAGGRPLAAYQFELTDPTGRAAIVGLEGGGHAAFREAPYYDPAALSRNRVIVAAFSTAKDLPKGKTRVARIHLQITGEGDPDLQIKLQVCASEDGERIPAEITFAQGERG